MIELLKYNEKDLLFYDIETAAIVKELELDTPLFNSWSYKVNRDNSMTDLEVVASYSKQASLYPEFSKIISIVVGTIQNESIKLVTIDDESEHALLTRFNEGLNNNMGRTLIGFVNIGFDTPFVFKRMLINGIKPNSKIDSSGLKPWQVDEVDLSKLWQGTSFNRASLINISTAFGLPSPKDTLDGSKVSYTYWNEGKKGLEKISKYCRQDVITTINIFRKMRLDTPLPVHINEEFEKTNLIKNLFKGAAFGKTEKKELKSLLTSMTNDERKLAFSILDSIVSSARGTKTKLTKNHIKTLKKEIK